MNAWIAHKTMVMTGLLFLAIRVTDSNCAPSLSQAAPAGAATKSSSFVVEKAQTAFDFVNSIGVNTHLNYFDRTYGNFPLVERELRSIGIRHLRDGAHLQNADYNKLLYGRWIELGKQGIRFDVVLDPRSSLGPVTPDLLEHFVDLSGHTIESFEGANELDISNMSGWPTVDRSFQQQIYGAAKALPDANSIRVIGPSLAFAANGKEFAGLLSGFDEGNLHPYPAGKMPSASFPEQVDLARQTFGDKPIVVTESGYHNALDDHSDQPAVSEQAAARYIPRLFLENFSKGIVRTYLYELFDEAPDPGLKDNQMHWGVIRADGTEKPAFAAIKRLIGELNDVSEPASSSQLSWSLSRTNPAVHHLLLQKSGREMDLVLWQEVSSYDVKSRKEIAVPPVRALLTLGSRARSVKLFDPVVQDEPIKSFADTATVPLDIPDHPLVIAINLN
jgi:hypothetical protein